MTRINTKLPDLKTQVLLWLGGLLLLGAVIVGLRWTTRTMNDRRETPPPTEWLRPTAPPATGVLDPAQLPASPTLTPTQPPVDSPVPPPPTGIAAAATHAPAATRDGAVFPVQDGDRGVYDVLRRACALADDHPLSGDDALVQETWRLNEFAGESPTIRPGQEIRVPVRLCP